jgi:O-antigen biosynthesis protein WbqP
MYSKYVKRIIDLVLAVLIMIVLIIPMSIIALISKISTNDSVIFCQVRSGVHRKPFVLYKYRTMPSDVSPNIPTSQYNDIEELNGWQRFLRKTSLDELPQLFNIIKSDMSFIGPRPVICAETDLIEVREKYGANDIKPGLTGWAQVNGRDCLDAEEKAKLDGEYVKKQSFLFDCKCFFMTIGTVFTDKGL